MQIQGNSIDFIFDADISRCHHWLPCEMTSEENLLLPIRSTAQIWVVTRHQYGIFALIPQTSFCEETNSGVVKSAFSG